MIELKWTHKGQARIWFVLSNKTLSVKYKQKYTHMMWAELFDAAEAGEI